MLIFELSEKYEGRDAHRIINMDLSEYRVGVVRTIKACVSKSGPPLKACGIQIYPGDDENLTVVTNAANVRIGSRVAVAPVGSKISSGSEIIVVKKASVGGVISEGIICDSVMLGWKGGAKGIAAQIPETYEIGSTPPDTKPRNEEKFEEKKEPTPLIKVEPLFEKKLTREEKRKLAEEKRKARREAKEAKKKAAEQKEASN